MSIDEASLEDPWMIKARFEEALDVFCKRPKSRHVKSIKN